MPRSARLDVSGVLHHVMGRGIEKRPIFLSDEDRTSPISIRVAYDEGWKDVLAKNPDVGAKLKELLTKRK